MGISQHKKREWFDCGAAAYQAVCPGQFEQPTYACPICLKEFTEEALADGRLSAEHVPPESVGGRELLLTCKACNNTAGTKLDADAKVKELVRSAMSGQREHRERVKASFGDLRVNAEVHLSGGKCSLVVPKHINRPGTGEALKEVARAGTTLTVKYRPFSELGAKISWFRAGYLALFRQQIRECDERRMITFTSEVPEEIPFTVRRIFRVLAPDWHRGWAVQFGRYFVHFPASGDVTFYDRMATSGSSVTPYLTTYQYVGWPTEPSFGLSE
jgi:hypothetical protein